MRRILLGLAVATVIATGATVVLLPHAAPRLIVWQLRALGLDDSAVASIDLGTSRVTLEGVRLLAGLSAERVMLDYTPWELIAGRLGNVAIDGLRVEARVGPDGTLELPGLERGSGGGGALPPLLPEAVRIDMASVTLASSDVRLGLEGSASFRIDRSGPTRFELHVERVVAARGGRTVQGTLDVDGVVQPWADAPLTTLHAQGSGSFAAVDLDLPAVGPVDLEGTLALQVRAGQVIVEGSDVLASAAGRGWLELVGGSGPVRATLGGDRPATLVFDLERPGAGRLTLSASLEAGGPAADLDVAVAFDAATDRGPLRVDDLRLELEARALVPGPRIERLRLELEGRGTPSAAALRGHLTLDASGAIGPATVQGLTLALPVALEVRPDVVEVALPEPGRLLIPGLALPDAGARGRLGFALPPAPVLHVQRRADLPWRLALPLRLDELGLAAGGLAVGDASASLTVEAAGRGADPESALVRLERGALSLPDHAIALDGMELEVPLIANGPVIDAVRFAVRAVRSLAKPALFAPVSVGGVLRPAPDRVMLEGALERSGLDLAVTGTWFFERAEGRASIELDPVRFTAGGLQPADLVPRAASVVEQVSGAVGLSGDVMVDAAGLRSDLELVLDDLGFVAGPVRVAGLSGTVVIDQPLPPATPPAQEIIVGLLDFGLAFADGRMRFELLPGGPLEVRRLRFDWAGGRIVAQPFTVGSADGVIISTLEARGLDLDAIFAQVRLSGLSGEGVIDGVLPVRIEDGEASIEQGRLVARRAGWLRYRPENPPEALAAGGASMALLLQALENFRYDELAITLDGRTDRAMDIQLHLKGANPELYDGHPVEFNLNLEGELANILRQGLRSYTLPDRVRERIEGSGGR